MIPNNNASYSHFLKSKISNTTLFKRTTHSQAELGLWIRISLPKLNKGYDVSQEKKNSLFQLVSISLNTYKNTYLNWSGQELKMPYRAKCSL